MDHVKPGGRHVILELYGVDYDKLTTVGFIKDVLIEGALKSGATVLGDHFHHFGEGYGVTGVIIMAESHATIHTWNEPHNGYDGYAAIDIFMCGNSNPVIAAQYIISKFEPKQHKLTNLVRG